MRTVARLAVVAVAIACSTPSPSGPAADGGREPLPDGRVDGPGDARGGPDADAAQDAPSGDGGNWCDEQGIHLFCEDFDEGALGQSWDGIDQEHGTARLDGTTYTSPFESFLATSTALTQGGVAVVRVGKRVAFVATEMLLAFDLKPEALDTTGAPVVAASIQTLDTLGEVVEIVNLTLRTGGASVDDYAPSLDGGVDFNASHPLAPAPSAGAWTRVRIDVVFTDLADAAPGSATLSVYVGGSTTPAIDHVPMAPSSQPGEPVVYLGVVTALGPSQGFALGFDNVTFDIQP